MTGYDAREHGYRLQLSGGRVAVQDVGSGPPVLLAHGFLWDRAMWAPQVRALSRHCRLIVPDMWGHGRSGALPPGKRGMDDLADQMIELLDRLEIDCCVLAGSSMGGMWAAHLATRAPSRVAGLVIMNSSLDAEPAAQRAVYAAILDRVASEGMVSDHIADLIVPLFFSADIASRRPELPRELRRRLAAFTPDALRHAIVPLGRIIFDRPEALAILSELEAPTLVIAGEDDRARPLHESAEMARLLGCGVAVLPNCGHTATLEQPERVNGLLLQFLNRLGWTLALE
jgi:pimeloyl-ACP methyl ester carboxylesterase